MFSITWPAPSRLIPAASESIKVTLVHTSGYTASKVSPRPAQGGQVTLEFENLPVGEMTAEATAHPNADGTGTVQARGTGSLTIRADLVTQTSVTMGSTIVMLEVAAPKSNIQVGESATLMVSARDAGGAMVLVSPGVLQWVSEAPNTARVDSGGTVTGLADGRATIRVTDTESGRTNSFVISIGGYNVTALPSLGSDCVVFAINNQGAAVGRCTSPTGLKAVRWSGGTITNLGALSPGTVFEATGINDLGEIVGNSTDKAFIFRNGTWTEIAPGHVFARAQAINNSGQVVVNTRASGEIGFKAGIWQNGTLTRFQTGESQGYAINAAGAVAGYYNVISEHAVIWDSGGFRDLGLLPNGSHSTAYAVNDSKVAAGFAGLFGPRVPFVWTEATGMARIGTDEGFAFGINTAGDIVGTYFPGGPRAFIYRNGTQTDLHTLAPGSGTVLAEARDINDSGQIVVNSGGSVYLLTPR